MAVKWYFLDPGSDSEYNQQLHENYKVICCSVLIEAETADLARERGAAIGIDHDHNWCSNAADGWFLPTKYDWLTEPDSGRVLSAVAHRDDGSQEFLYCTCSSCKGSSL
jgi:hypothetical protein